MVIMRRATRRRPLRRALAPRRKAVQYPRFVTLTLAAGAIGTIDMRSGTDANDTAGLTHVATWGQVAVYPTTIPVAATTTFRWAHASRLDTIAVATLASAALLPLRSFGTAAVNGQDRSWRDRRLQHSVWQTGASAPTIPAGPPAWSPNSQLGNYTTRKLGTLDAGESWYMYFENTGIVSITIIVDYQLRYLLS